MVVDLFRTIQNSDEKREVLPKFVIYEHDEIPILSGEVKAILNHQVNELHSTVGNLIDHLNFFRSAKNKATVTFGQKSTKSQNRAKPSYYKY